jgi:hypothetical protein
MFVHVYYKGGQDELGMPAPRVTVFTDAGRIQERYKVDGSVLVIGTLPDITVIPMSKIDSFWVED